MRQAGHKPGWQVHPNDEESVNAYMAAIGRKGGQKRQQQARAAK